MNTPEFGSDPMDQFSIPLKREKTHLGELLSLSVRQRSDKPGRSLSIVWDERAPLIEGFANRYSYFVTFQEKGSLAGNHYHLEKQEIYFPLIGDFTVIFENPENKEREEIELKTSEHNAIFVPAGVAHVVRAESEIAILLVTATSPQVDRDEFEYRVLLASMCAM